jgi:hypothetical protein
MAGLCRDVWKEINEADLDGNSVMGRPSQTFFGQN